MTRRVELYRGLPDAALRRRIEAEHGIFVVEGARSLRTLLGSPFPLVSILLLSERLDGLADVLAAAHERRAPVFVAGRRVFDGIAGFPAHRGVLALARRLPQPDPMTVLAQVSTAVVVEGVNDHENLGAIFRNAAALGAGAVLLDPSCCDPLYRRSVRVSMAHVLRLPFTRLAPWPDALAELGAAGFTVVALDPGASDTIDALAQGPARARPAEGWPRSAASGGIGDGRPAHGAHRPPQPLGPAAHGRAPESHSAGSARGGRREWTDRGGPTGGQPSGANPDGAGCGLAQRGDGVGYRPSPPDPTHVITPRVERPGPALGRGASGQGVPGLRRLCRVVHRY